MFTFYKKTGLDRPGNIPNVNKRLLVFALAYPNEPALVQRPDKTVDIPATSLADDRRWT